MSNGNGSVPDGFRRVDNAVVRVIRFISYFSAVALVGIMLVAFFNVLGEKVLKSGIPASTEIIKYLHVPVVFLAAAYVTLDRGHTRIDLISSKLPPRVQTVCDFVGYVLAAFICGFVSWRGFIRMGMCIERHTRSSVSGAGFAVWPFALMLALGFLMLAFSFAWSVVRLCVKRAAPSEGDMEGGGE